MTGRAEDDPMAAVLYPNHKQFGVLVWLLALVHLALRRHYSTVLPHEPAALKPWEKWLSHAIHRLIIALTLITPMLGYAMSSSLPDGDGVPFFFLAHVPEILPKSEAAFAVFQALHKYSAYVLLGLIGLHVAGALKHRWRTGTAKRTFSADAVTGPHRVRDAGAVARDFARLAPWARHPHRRGGDGVLGPGVLRVAAAEIGAHRAPGAAPEARQVAGDWIGRVGRRQQFQHQGHLAGGDGRVNVEPERSWTRTEAVGGSRS